MIKIREYLSDFLSRTFDIREGEMRRVLLLQLNIFLVISTLLIVKPTVNGLFLAKFGAESLPRAFILVAVFAGLISVWYARALNRVSLLRIIKLTLRSSILTLALFGLFLRLNFLESWVLYCFYLWVSIFAVLSASQFWVLASMVFNTREAKRLFGFIGAGAIAGGIFGGYLTSLLAPWIGSENLPFAAAVLLAFCLPITGYLWRNNITDSPIPLAKKKKKSRQWTPIPLQQIMASRHLSLLAGIVGVSVVVAKLVDYQFSDLAALHIPDPDELTAFLGFWFSTFNLISLFLQLFLTRRLVGNLGVGTALFFLPGSIFVAAVLLFFFPELWVAVLLKLADGSLKQSINKAAVELLILPIPQEVKNQSKTFIDVFVDSLATGISGLILIFVISGLDLSTRAISVIILLLLMVWGWLALAIRKEYLHHFKRRVGAVGVTGSKQELDLTRESVVGGLKKVLLHGAEKQILFVLEKIREARDDRFFVEALPLLQHPSSDIRAATLHYLYFIKSQSIVDQAEALTQDVSQKVKIKAFEYLIEHRAADRKTVIERYLQEDDYRVYGAALVSLAFEIQNNAYLKQEFRLEERAAEALRGINSLTDAEEQQFMRIMVLKVIAYGHLTAYYHYISESLGADAPEVARQAILSAGFTQDPVFVPSLISLLTDKKLKPTVAQALGLFGEKVLSVLKETMAEPDSELTLIRNIPSVIGQIGTQPAVDFLFQQFEHPDQVVRFEVLRALNHLNNEFPHLRFQRERVIRNILLEAQLYSDTLAILYVQSRMARSNGQHNEVRSAVDEGRAGLIRLLEGRLDRNLERIFRLLGLKYPPDDIYNIYRSIQSKKTEMRDDALEFLDNLLEPNLKKVLIPLVETAMMEGVSEKVVKRLGLKIPGEYECYALLLNGKDVRIMLAVLYIIRQLEDPRYIPLVKTATQRDEEKVRKYALDTLEMIGGSNVSK